MTSVSFKFAKNTRSQLPVSQGLDGPFQNRKKDDSEREESDRILVSGFGKKGAEDVITSLTANNEKKELVIPALENTIKLNRPAGDADYERAKQALLEDAKRFSGNSTENVVSDMSSIPVGPNQADKLNVSDIAAEEADYDSVPVDLFGKALLRGMGWQEGEAIGRSGKKATVPLITAPRPKGLGLGAEAKPQPATSGRNEEGGSKELTLKIGSYVKRVDAKGDKDRYGKVISWDEDNACVVVQTAIGKSSVRLSHHVVQVVLREEYEKSAKCINQGAYDQFKEEEQRKLPPRRDNQKEPSKRDEQKKVPEKDEEMKKVPPKRVERDQENFELNTKRERGSEKRHSHESSSKRVATRKSWLQPDIRVRIVDDKYRRGKFYKTKAVIIDVKSAGVCSCVAEDGKTLLDDLTEDMLETVVPRKTGASVVIVRGSSFGKIGTILERDSHTCVAVVKLQDSVKTVPYDDICEYAGDGEF